MALRKSLLLAVSAASILVSAGAFANDASTDATAAAPAAHAKHKGHAHKAGTKAHAHKAHAKKDQASDKDVTAPATEEAK